MDIFYCNAYERILLEKFLKVFGIVSKHGFHYLNGEPIELIYNDYQVGLVRYFDNNSKYKELLDHLYLILHSYNDNDIEMNVII